MKGDYWAQVLSQRLGTPFKTGALRRLLQLLPTAFSRTASFRSELLRSRRSDILPFIPLPNQGASGFTRRQPEKHGR